jgi:hypothetical protein
MQMGWRGDEGRRVQRRSRDGESRTESEAKVPWNETDRRAETRKGNSRQGRRSRKVKGDAKGRADRDAGTTQWRLVATPAAILLRSESASSQAARRQAQARQAGRRALLHAEPV